MKRILDLGASDGYLGKWLLDNHADIHVDAIELNEAAAQICRSRINGECKVGFVERAPEYFDQGTYDLVYAYELIEHVPDVDEFLDAAEAMCKDGGRVLVSTPDGTYGKGANPEHLRVFRAIDLADLLRRRGELLDMEVGGDGIATAAYSPKPRKLDITIFTGGGWERWAPTDIFMKGLGGSETAATYLALELSRLGHVVTVYGEVTQTVFRDVIFKHQSTFDPTERTDLFISSRIPQIFDRPINTGQTMLWLHDVDCGPELTMERAEKIDQVLVLSKWHEKHVKDCYPFVGRKLKRIRNGINPKLFKPTKEPRKQRVLYTSSPDRGVDVLLEIWPKVRERVPEAELAFCYPSVYDAVADQVGGPVAEHRKKVQRLADQPGVTKLGPMTQPDLAALMQQSWVWVHPSWVSTADQPFHETSCIGAMEAQAAGCVVVCADWGALKETANGPACVRGDTQDREWLVDSIAGALTDIPLQLKARKYAPQAIKKHLWSGVAERVDSLVAR